MPKMSITFRKGRKEDMKSVIAMNLEFAAYQDMPNGPELTEEDLIRDGGFDAENPQHPLFFSFIAEEEETDQSPGTDIRTKRAIGFAIGFNTYSTWEGKTLYLINLYVKESHRRQGIGRRMFIEVAKYARDTDCNRFDFHVLDWNPASKFYDDLKAVNMTKSEGWQLYRMKIDEITKVLVERNIA